ncbi:AMP-binding protein [Terricaulis silvestris]|uniref:Long-chain-fatty-acid--CoA ligase FadD13 n=1 Tax=Terricaulis silvestris TaxID=2686094 RepID=A0A6I6MTN4_9CAUL|nr:AMP-binding protein [Terricaulis silvestris]QGZ96137.1 Long-chain-fatty-acid--CoA ligase FadD13 [Terricaulis silvestris]
MKRREITLPPQDAVKLPMGVLPAYHAARTPKAPAITVDHHTVTFGELEASANRRARMMAARGVGQDDLVMLSAPNGLAFYETAFAAWKLGASVCHVNARLPDPELSAIVDLARPKLIVGAAPAGWSTETHLLPDAPVDQSLSPEALEPSVARHWKVSTSGGSTGRPKLIVDRMPSLWSPEFGSLGQRPGDVTVNPAPLYHNAPFGLMHVMLFIGGHVVEMKRFEPCRMLELVARWRATWLYLVPTMMHRIWRIAPEKRERHDLSSLELIIHMAAACPVWLKENWIDWLGPDVLWELYGGTEVLGATIINGREWLEHKGSVGRLWMGKGMKVLDERGDECAPGQIGEIYFDVSGGQPYEYVGAEARRRGDWQSFGDMGYLDADGYLYIADRRTDMIISGGANVYPAEVEAALEEHPNVGSSVVIGLPDDDLGHRVHALVELAPNAKADAHGLKVFLATRISGHKIPKTFEFTSEPLRDEAGKVRRSALRDERL